MFLFCCLFVFVVVLLFQFGENSYTTSPLPDKSQSQLVRLCQYLGPLEIMSIRWLYCPQLLKLSKCPLKTVPWGFPHLSRNPSSPEVCSLTPLSLESLIRVPSVRKIKAPGKMVPVQGCEMRTRPWERTHGVEPQGPKGQGLIHEALKLEL